jgi:hypothetical protein
MTKEAIRKAMGLTLSEFFDGYVLMGCVAGERKVIIIQDINDPITKAALTTAVNLVQKNLAHGPAGQ